MIAALDLLLPIAEGRGSNPDEGAGVLLIIGIIVLALVVSAPAHGAVFPGQVIAGPSTNIVSEPSLAIAPDGTGVVAYRQGDGGNARVWASRRVGGAWQPPQQLTSGADVTTSNVVVGAANGGRAIVAFKGGTGVSDGAFRYSPGGGQPFGPLTAIRMSDVSSLALDMNAGGVSYALVQTSGPALFAYRIVGGTVTPVGAPDAVDTNAAGSDFINPDAAIAVDAAGNAVAAWWQNPAPNTALARRITGTALAPAAVTA